MSTAHNSITERKISQTGTRKWQKFKKTIVTKGFLIYESKQKKIWHNEIQLPVVSRVN